MTRFTRIAFAAAVSAGLMAAAPLVADTIEIRRETSKQTITDVTVKGVKGENLVFLSSGGNDAERPLANVYRLEIKGETALNDAEKAYAAETWPEAADLYTKALKSASKDWIRDRISLRLVDLAGKTKRFDVAASGYISLVASNPALAATVKPTIPEDKDPKTLSSAVADIDKALGDSKLPADRKAILLQFELELDNALGDKKAATAVVEQLLRTGALNANDPASQKQLGDLKVAVAQMALDDKQYPKATSTIEEARTLLTDPTQQAAALYILAEAKYQTALANKASEKTAWQDIAIAFMRVVGQFPDSPRAADALARTASCYEQLKDNDRALNTYQLVVKQYGNSAAAKTAQAAITRLKDSK